MDDLLELRQSELRRHVASTLNQKRVPSLKRMCRSRGMLVGGRKADLVERLVADVIEKGWTVSTEADLWQDYSALPDSPADSKRSKTARYHQASISNLDDSDSGRSSPPSSSASSSPSSTLTSVPDDSSVDSMSGEAEAGPSVRVFDFCGSPLDEVADACCPVSRKKKVALFVDTEAPDKKRKKNLSGQSNDSGIHPVSRRPHLTRRALKANLRKTSSRRSGTDFLSRSNVGVVFNAIKDYAIRESRQQEEVDDATVSRSSRPPRRKKNNAAPALGEDSTRLGVRDVVPISIVSCESLRKGEAAIPHPPVSTPLTSARTDFADISDSDASSSTSIVATLTSPTGVPVAIVTTQPSSPVNAEMSDDVPDDFQRSNPAASKPPVTPAIEWIRLD